MTRTADSIAEVVSSGLCIGCGLCEAVTRSRVSMTMTSYGSLRPTPADSFTRAQEKWLLSVCPGVAVERRFPDAPETDPVWGAFSSMRFAWAGDAQIRYRAATGGVLTALGVHLLKAGAVEFILHVSADPGRPMRSCWLMSETPDSVVAAAGSRYGPVAPLAGLLEALDRARPFAIIAKPCDLSAVHQLSRIDSRVTELCVMRLAMVCGGQSRLTKSSDVLTQLGLVEEQVSLVRYRGFGNPGKTRIETQDGQTFEETYLDLWEDESGWQLETRCKLCPDALGEAADIVAADVWPGGSPTHEDAGFNGIIVRSEAGEALVRSATNAGDLVLGDGIAARRFDEFQPHQVRKKQALAARFDALASLGMPVVGAQGLRLDALRNQNNHAELAREGRETVARARAGRFTEPLPVPAGARPR